MDDKEGIIRKVSEALPDKQLKITIREQSKTVRMPDMVMVFQQAALACSMRLNGSCARILLFFISQSQYGNYVTVDIEFFMEKLQLSKSSVVRGLKELVEHNVIIKLANPVDSRRHDYYINPNVGWKGKSINRKEAMMKIDKNQLDLFNTNTIPKISE
jgi:predicted transcriptional regulator